MWGALLLGRTVRDEGVGHLAVLAKQAVKVILAGGRCRGRGSGCTPVRWWWCVSERGRGPRVSKERASRTMLGVDGGDEGSACCGFSMSCMP